MPPVIGIRREDKNEWERRVPLAPRHVKALVQHGIEVWIQPSAIRIFPDDEYAEVGAQVREDLSACKVVFGIKEFPIWFLRPRQAYAFFSHTIKGQKHNMPLLAAILARGCTLLDYERVTDEHNRRQLYFGNYAGLAGMIETLYTLGRRLAWEGVDTPLLAIRRPLEYGSLGQARAALEVVGRWIAAVGLPKPVCPLVIGFAGYGNVSTGAQEILDLLPVEEIQPGQLAEWSARGEYSRRRLYKVVFYEKDMVVPLEPGQPFDLQDYYDHPEKYAGVFEQYLAHLTVLVNGIYWDARYPRLVTRAWLKEHWTPEAKLKVIGDISCDLEGAVECTLVAANPGQPVYVYLPQADEIRQGIEGKGPVIMAVDTLPAELPRESSLFFGDLLLPHVPPLAEADLDAPFQDLDLPPELKRAIIVHQGRLTPDYEYLAAHLAPSVSSPTLSE